MNLISENIPANKIAWYSWIPTNIGYLNFNYIAEEKNIKSIFGEDSFSHNVSSDKKAISLYSTNLSDINCIVKDIFQIDEVTATADIEFQNTQKFNSTINRMQPSDINGEIIFLYTKKENQEQNLLLKIKASFSIERNGKIKIYNIQIDRNEDFVNELNLIKNNGLLNTIVNGIYTIVKKIVHGDNHHYQKIDTLIGVYTDFVPSQIITDLGFQIKRLDKFVKYNDDDSIALIYKSDKLDSIEIAEGFLSYIKTFKELFRKEIREDKTKHINDYFISYNSIENTIKSIKAGVDKIKSKTAKKNNRFVFIVSLIGLFSTLNILISTTLLKEYNLSEFSNFLAHYICKWDMLYPRDLMAIILFIVVIVPTFGKLFIEYLNNKIREKMSSSQKYYSFLEVLILFSYINKKELSAELINGNIDNLNKLDKYVMTKFKLIVSSSLISITLAFLIILNANIYFYIIPALIFFYICYLIFIGRIKSTFCKK